MYALIIRGAFSISCPVAVKTASTTLIFVQCITFHKANLLYDVHEVKLFSTTYNTLLSIVLAYTAIQQTWSNIDIPLTCPEELLVTFGITRTHRMRDTVSIWYAAAGKFCVVEDSPVMNWPCIMSIKMSSNNVI